MLNRRMSVVLRKMARSSSSGSLSVRDQKGRGTCNCSRIRAAFLFSFLFFIWGIWVAKREKPLVWNLQENISKFLTCENECRPLGTETLPKGIIMNTSNLERRPLWGYAEKLEPSRSLFAVVAGIKQSKNVDELVQKFLGSNFVVMLFHYDGIVDGWKVFDWSNRVIHVSVENQTKWWFAKRFLHPDIVADYDYVFLWDEDLGVDNFSPDRYLSIVRNESLEISQPALDIEKSEVHHLITARWKRTQVHRRAYKHGDTGVQCDGNSTAPPCTGWIEVMAPVFSKAAWRCVWYMIQNDLIHAWGVDLKLGYCAQGNRTNNIGVVDAEYVVHYGLPTLGEPKKKGTSKLKVVDKRIEVRRQSYREYRVFKRRWKKAVEEDGCFVDPYPDDEKLLPNQTTL